MRNILFFCTLVSLSANASDVYHSSSKCIIQQGVPSEKVSASVIAKSANREEELRRLKKALFDKVLAKAKKYKHGVEVAEYRQNVSNAEKITSDKFVSASIKLKPVFDCSNNAVKVTNNNYQHLGGDIVALPMATTWQTEIKVTAESPRHRRELLLPSEVVTQDSVFGLKLGSTFGEAEALFGRFSIVWPLLDNKKIAIIGREHALFFNKDKFVAYQYNKDLLPVTLKNSTEIAATTITLALPGGTYTKSIDSGLTDSEVEKLSSVFDEVEVENYLVADELINKRVVGFYIGKEYLFSLTSKLDCLNERHLSGAVQFDRVNLAELYNMNGRRIMLSGCGQFLSLNISNQVKELQLIEPWSNYNVALYRAADLTESMQPWQFKGLKYGSTVSQLRAIGQVEVESEVAEFESGEWLGNFILDENKLVAATLLPIAL